MKRNPRKLKWTKAFRKSAGKEMTVDSTLQFAARRNVPVRYDRELVAKTVAAMGRIQEIRTRRERVFYKKRMAGKRERELASARKLVAENQHLLPRLRGSEKRRLAEEAGLETLDAETEAAVVKQRGKGKTVAFGAELRRLRVRADGGVDEEMEAVEGAGYADGFEDEDDNDDEASEADDTMDMD